MLEASRIYHGLGPLKRDGVLIGLLRKLRVGTNALTPSALQLNAALPQHLPDLVGRDIPQGPRHQAPRPGTEARRRWLVQLRQDAADGVRPIHRRFARPGLIAQPSQPTAGESPTPLTHRGRPQRQPRGDLLGRASRRRCQDDAGSQGHALLRGPLPGPRRQLGMFLIGQRNCRRHSSHGRSIQPNVYFVK